MMRIAVAAGMGLALAACSGPSSTDKANESLPDLTSEGLTAIECGEGEVFGETFEAPGDGYVAECWTGVPDKNFDDYATDVNFDVRDALGTEDVTSTICPEDVLVDFAGVACRASYKDDVVVRVVVALVDPEGVTSALSDEPTAEDVDAALAGAEVEVLIQTEPVPEA